MKRKAAAIGLAVWIVIFSLLGGHMTLKKEYGRVADVFTQGVEGDGLSIAHDLSQRADAAYNLTVIAQRYLGAEDSLVAGVRRAREGLLAASGAAQKYTASAREDGPARRCRLHHG